MNRQRIIHKLRLSTAIGLVTVIVVGCATARFDAPPPPTGTGSSGGVEEIVVTGSARPKIPQVGRHDQFDRNSRRGVAEGSAMAAADPVFAFAEPGDELWIIAAPLAAPTPERNEDDAPGSGAMVASFADGIGEATGSARSVPLPLKHTAVSAEITGYISAVNVRQKFENPFDEKIEAVYMFPLPEKAAVSEFLMIIGERRIRGILRAKEEAEAIYNEARSQGYQASLLVQHRPNIFEQKVANIEPGEVIDVDIRYFHTLSYSDGWYAFVFPAVVGPRYNPPEHREPVVAVPRGSILPAAGGTAVRYLRPDERSAHDLSINISIDAGVVIEELQSSHQVVTSQNTAETATVELASQTTIPNRDFILRFQVAGDTIKSNLLTYVDPDTRQGYFTLMIYPPSGLESLARRPMEMVFVLDCSGSMNGRPLEQAKTAVATALDHLQEGDTFQIIRFSDDSSQFGATPVPATRQNLQHARRYLERLNGTGGTQMIEGIKAALDFPHDPARLRFVSFMTDGYIGNETEILAAMHSRIGSSRVFSFGVGSSVNRYLLERMAKEGRGAVAYLGPHDAASEIMGAFFDRISHPALTDLRFDWGSMAVTDVYPAKLPDLFVGRPVVVTGKYLGAADDVRVSGMAGTVKHGFDIAADRSDAQNAYIPRIWARLRIAELSDRLAWVGDPYGELAAAIRSTAIDYQLMSAYTSFVAVDSSRRTDGGHGTTVHQAIPVPEGVRYETTVDPN